MLRKHCTRSRVASIAQQCVYDVRVLLMGADCLVISSGIGTYRPSAGAENFFPSALSKVRGGGGSKLGSTQVRTPGPPGGGGGGGGGGWEQQHREFFFELSEQKRSTVLVFGL